MKTLVLPLLLLLAHPVYAQNASTVWVDQLNPQASDVNSGTETSPFKTINKAVAIAMNKNQSRLPIRVVIGPGVYRESIVIPSDFRETDAAITIEAKEIGKTIISGSDVWDGWVRRGTTDTYEHPWPYHWGLAPLPPFWEGNVTVNPIVRRREMVFFNGAQLSQVLSAEELRFASFFADETAGKILLRPAEGISMERATIEVAVRSGILKVTTKQNVTIRGLTFTHDNTPLQGSAGTIDTVTNALLEDNTFAWNNWGGLSILNATNVTLKRNVSSHNGVTGIDSWKVKNLTMEENVTSYNNWRGASGQFLGWTAAGAKLMLTHGLAIRGHRSIGNQTRGLWLDTDCTDVTIERATLGENMTDGLFLEVLQGPVAISESLMYDNRENGIVVANAQKITLSTNVLYNNHGSQILMSGGPKGTRDFSDWETKTKVSVGSGIWTVKGNAIVGQTFDRLLMKTSLDVATWGMFVTSSQFNRNVWHNPDSPLMFQPAGSTPVDFLKWKLLTVGDMDSVFADPLFTDPGALNFQPQPNSPLISIAGWPAPDGSKVPNGPSELRAQ